MNFIRPVYLFFFKAEVTCVPPVQYCVRAAFLFPQVSFLLISIWTLLKLLYIRQWSFPKPRFLYQISSLSIIYRPRIKSGTLWGRESFRHRTLTVASTHYTKWFANAHFWWGNTVSREWHNVFRMGTSICCSATVSWEWHSVFRKGICCSTTVSREWHSVYRMGICCSTTVSREWHSVFTMHICCSTTVSRGWYSFFRMGICCSATVSREWHSVFRIGICCSATVSREWHSVFRIGICCSATVSRKWHSVHRMHVRCSATVSREWHSIFRTHNVAAPQYHDSGTVFLQCLSFAAPHSHVVSAHAC